MGQIQISAGGDGIFDASGLGFGFVINPLNREWTPTTPFVKCDAAAKCEQAANDDVKPSHTATVRVQIAPRNGTYAKLMQNLYTNYTVKTAFYVGAPC